MDSQQDVTDQGFLTDPLVLIDREIVVDGLVHGTPESDADAAATAPTLVLTASQVKRAWDDLPSPPVEDSASAEAYLAAKPMQRKRFGSSAGWLHNQWVWMALTAGPAVAQLGHLARKAWDATGVAPGNLLTPFRRLINAAGVGIDAVAARFSRHALLIFLFSLLFLLSIGAVMIFSASAKTAMKIASIGDAGFYIKKHLIFLGVGLLACAALSHVSIERIRRWIVPLSLGMVVVLMVVLVPGIGTEYNGARRWLRFAGFGFQPSDAAKLVVVFALAHLVLTRSKQQNATLREGFLPPAAYLAAVCGLVLLEPDFGTCLFIAATGLIVMLIAGVRPRVLIPIALIAIPLLSVVVIMKFDHVKPRIEAFLDPYADPMGKGYQTRQSLIAMGAGGFTGQGLGQSRQALAYLPEESTDFIFAILGEELGFVGTAGTLLAYLALVLAGFTIALRSRDRYAKVVTAGMTALIGLQAVINIAVVTATVPNKGIALPFISFGGSLTVFYLAGAGVIIQTAFATIREEKAMVHVPQPMPAGKGEAALLFHLAQTVIRPEDAGAGISEVA